jgi:release factor glutamine methyltransferase
MVESQIKSVGDVLSLAAAYLGARGVEEARLKSEMLMARLLRLPRLELSLHAGRALREEQVAAMRRGVKRLGEGEPVQYVTGEAGFLAHVFKCDRRALIPRPETEILVQCVLGDEALWALGSPSIVDVGTGSGCIVLSLAAARPQGRYLAVDISPEALCLARENAALLGLGDGVIFYEGRLGDIAEPEMLDAIVANLPYIPQQTIETLPRSVRDYEPRLALDGGVSGLDAIEDLVADAAIVLKNGGKIFLEIGSEQGASVVRLLAGSGFSEVNVLPDLNGRDRVVTGVIGMEERIV